MTDYPLKIFLTSLHSDGITMSARDYEQLLVIFQTGGNWTISRLKNVLTAFLANDLEQQELIRRRFDKYFAKEIETEKELSEFDICRGINDLKSLSSKKNCDPQKTTSVIKPLKTQKPEITQIGSIRKYFWGIAGLLIVLIAIIGVKMSKEKPIDLKESEEKRYKISTTIKKKSNIVLRPHLLDFGSKDVNSSTYKQIIISNNGSRQFTIQNIKQLNKTPDTFIISTTKFPIDLKANENFVISVGFIPQKEGLFIDKLEIVHNAENHLDPITIKGSSKKLDPTVRQQRLYTDVPYVKEIKYVPIDPDSRWIKYAGISMVLLISLLVYSYYLYRLKRGPKDKKAKWSKDGPQFFDHGSIGKKQGPRLDEKTIAYLADSMGYFKSESPGKTLNVPHSITATVHHGGIPSCEFFTRKKIRTLLILEDAYAEALDWNPVPKELAEGMNRFGIPVIYGRFRGAPDKFKTQDGSVFHLDDFEDHSNGIVLLIFTDGKSFQGLKNSFTLEAIARWPMVAWMELRDQRFWDESSNLAMTYKIPIFPATAAGLVQVIQSFLTEQGLQNISTETKKTNLPNIFNNKPELWIEHFLGNALLWAQDCSMMQPISSSMAQNLREKFYPHLSADEIECLHALPNTTTIESNIHFSDDILKVLRDGFMSRKSEDEQNQVILYILEQVEAAKPDVPKESLAYLSWESIKERVRLELGSDDDLEQFGKLINSPLGESISDKLDNYGFSGDKISMREPKSKKAKVRLAKVSGNPLGIHLISRMHKACFVILLLSLFSALVASSFFRIESQKNTAVLHNLYNNTPYIIVWETNQKNSSNLLFNPSEVLRTSSAYVSSFTASNADSHEFELMQGKCNLHLFGNGYYTTKNFEVDYPSRIHIFVEKKDIYKNCIENIPNMNMTVQYCSDNVYFSDEQNKTICWKERSNASVLLENRFISVGLEITDKTVNSEIVKFRNTLLETGSIDILYRINSQSSNDLQKALSEFQKKSLPFFNQLIIWSNGIKYDLEEFYKWDKILNLGNISSWIYQLQTIFEPDVNIAISEEEILNKLDNAKVLGEGKPVVLFRPEPIKINFSAVAWKTLNFSGKTAAFYSPSGKYLAVLSHSDRLVLYDKFYNKLNEIKINKLNTGTTNFGHNLAFSPDEQFLAFRRKEAVNEVVFASVPGLEILQNFSTHSKYVNNVSFSPDGKFLASGSYDETIKIWKFSLEKFTEMQTLKDHSNIVNTVSFSPNDKFLASGSYDKTIKIWKFSSGKFTETQTLKGHSDVVMTVSFSPDGNFLASGSCDKTIKIWKFSSGEFTEIQTLEDHYDNVNSVSFSPDGKFLASGSSDKTIKIWKLASEIFSKMQTLKGHYDWVNSVSFSPDGKFLASGSDDNIVKIWKLTGVGGK